MVNKCPVVKEGYPDDTRLSIIAKTQIIYALKLEFLLLYE